MGYHALTHKISGRENNNLPVCPMKDVQYLSHMATLATDGNYINQLTTNAPHAN